MAQAEINVLTGVRHRHLVSLLGFVQDEGERLLIYEYMALVSPHPSLAWCRARVGSHPPASLE